METAKIIGCDDKFYPVQPGLEKDEWGAIPTRWVLVAGEVEDYACYVGHGTKEWVARLGDKVSFQTANIHFCGQLEESRYRL